MNHQFQPVVQTWRGRLRQYLFVLAIIVSQYPATGIAEDTLGARLAAAERYASSIDFDHWYEEFLGFELRKLDDRQRIGALKLIKEELRPQTVRNIIVNAMVQVYTAEELNALADFYATPLGRSALQKMPQAYKVMAPAIEQEVSRAFAAIRMRTAK
jgi:hypothetical protein